MAKPDATTKSGPMPGDDSSDGTWNLPDGDALSDDGAAVVMRARDTQVVVLAGPVESGKTTLLVSVFESLQEAPLAGFRFAGSQTLVGFERRAHDGRVDSNRDTAHTNRTPQGDSQSFLHLRLGRGPASREARDLMLVDVSGEQFRGLRDFEDDALGLAVLKRADLMALLVDGDKLRSPQERAALFADCRLMLRSIFEANILHPTCRIGLVFSKWDLMLPIVARPDELQRVQTFERGLATLCKEWGREEPSTFRVAARPDSFAAPYAFGVSELVDWWWAGRAMPSEHQAHPSEGGEPRQMALYAKRYTLSQTRPRK